MKILLIDPPYAIFTGYAQKLALTTCKLYRRASCMRTSACIVVDGQLIAAAEKERFRRIKHWAGFPMV